MFSLSRNHRLIITPDDLAEVAQELGVRPDWHEPDEQGVTVEIVGQTFDNAGFWGDYRGSGNREISVLIFKNDRMVGEVNLATLFAWATEYAKAQVEN